MTIFKQQQIGTPELDEFVKSQAFYENYRNDIGAKILYELQVHDPIEVEYQCEHAEFAKILQHVEGVWTKLGETDPHWSVVSTERYRAANIDGTIEQFHRTGENEARNLRRILARSGITPKKSNVALEYGCGLGRVTRWLAQMFPQVIGIDISTSHLKLAKEYFEQEHIENIDLIKVSTLSDVEQLPGFDFLYSKIVLQHNPPPLIHRTLEILCDKLQPGGVAVIQIPTYCKNYNFKISEYITNMDKIDRMEMHVLPQSVIFDLLDKHGCLAREVFRDHLVRSMDYVSTTFVFEKRSDG